MSVAVIVTSAGLAVSSVVTAVGGQPSLSFALLSAIWAFLGFWGVLFRVSAISAAPRLDTDDAGTTFRPGRTWDVLQIVVLGVQSCYAGFFLAMWVWQFSTAGLSPIERPSMLFIGAVVPLALIPFFATLFWGRWRLGAFAYLRMTPDGIQLSAGPWLRSIAWEQVSDVTNGGGGLGYARSVMVVAATSGRRRVFEAAMFSPGGRALQGLVRFYWRNPGFRDELVNGAVADRFAESLARV
ncbi:hypothetical protein [Mycolicibacterium sp. P1-18]|uniref:hypothetical protein n=1 Tax=Mycolicibacterium sp. P1-18 TaxID=2024615 RepID=UPI0011F35C3C|nr:hypothetical protein [Mycolicibacterium sp. P1-18]